MLSLYDILKASKTGIAPDMWTALAGKNWNGTDTGHEVKELTGIPPLSFRSDGTPLLDYLISGNMSQTGTPTPDSPIQPSECGKLVNSQWTLPISSAGQTNNIYLGNVQTTRYVKKLVLDGTENWAIANNRFRLVVPDYLRIRDLLMSKCSHYEAVPNGTAAADAGDNQLTFLASSSSSMYMYIGDVPHRGMLDDFKSFLAQQYANGTPVTVWYVLATPETAVVNEPIRKIGDYADTVSYEQAQVSIPTLNGQTVVDVDTTLKPSEVYIKYKE